MLPDADEDIDKIAMSLFSRRCHARRQIYSDDWESCHAATLPPSLSPRHAHYFIITPFIAAPEMTLPSFRFSFSTRRVFTPPDESETILWCAAAVSFFLSFAEMLTLIYTPLPLLPLLLAFSPDIIDTPLPPVADRYHATEPMPPTLKMN